MKNKKEIAGNRAPIVWLILGFTGTHIQVRSFGGGWFDTQPTWIVLRLGASV